MASPLGPFGLNNQARVHCRLDTADKRERSSVIALLVAVGQRISVRVVEQTVVPVAPGKFLGRRERSFTLFSVKVNHAGGGGK